MIRIADIQNALLPLVGWHQDFSPMDAIDDSLTQSESGLYYQDAHPLMTLKNVRSIMPDNFLTFIHVLQKSNSLLLTFSEVYKLSFALT